MPTELRSYYSNEYIEELSWHIANLTARSTNTEISRTILCKEWHEMSLKTRMHHITTILRIQLKQYTYAESLDILQELLLLITTGKSIHEDMLAMFIPNYVEQYGLEEGWEISMKALAFFTSNGTTSEFAIRPFLQRDLQRGMAQMLSWSQSPNEHIRRLASEGCRPRLPWASHITALQQDPSLIIPILTKLRADGSLYVRKSVANNLNDIAKDNPELTLEWARKWYNTHSHTGWIIKRGCRTLLKQAHPGALKLFNLTPITIKTGQLLLPTTEVALGEELCFSFTATIDNIDNSPPLRAEYAIDFMKANGKLSRKIFQLKSTRTTGNQLAISANHKLKQLTTRKHYAGRHNLVIILNGQEVASHEWRLVM